ncbi:hypothetical protein GGP41_004007 [Bipolaris sorokiniana]|uniref:Uncharacterized protein n=1 Tax=Cochliobolus sativus TaxID=45130 RepID=A0A8H5ZJ38_COCSA|nr:hypothetical protein GGP41_004007 [Bipolaris sorokiniana]
MPPKNALADAWDDDWESLADKEEEKPAEEQPKPKLTKAQLKAQHAEFNKQLWQAAYATPHIPFITSRADDCGQAKTRSPNGTPKYALHLQ